MNVLLVGVDAATRVVIGNSISARLHEQTCAETGDEGLALARASLPPLIVVEDPLPDMRAADFC